MNIITVTIPCGKKFSMRELAGKPGKYVGWVVREGSFEDPHFFYLHELEELFPVQIEQGGSYPECA